MYGLMISISITKIYKFHIFDKRLDGKWDIGTLGYGIDGTLFS